MEYRASVRIARCPQLAFVRRDDRATDRQAESEAARLRGHERLKDLFELALCDSRPAIAHRYDHLRAVVDTGAQCQSSIDLRRLLHRVARVQDEIEQDLK